MNYLNFKDLKVMSSKSHKTIQVHTFLLRINCWQNKNISVTVGEYYLAESIEIEQYNAHRTVRVNPHFAE